MAKLLRKLKWLVFFWDTVYIGSAAPGYDEIRSSHRIAVLRIEVEVEELLIKQSASVLWSTFSPTGRDFSRSDHVIDHITALISTSDTRALTRTRRRLRSCCSQTINVVVSRTRLLNYCYFSCAFYCFYLIEFDRFICFYLLYLF